LAAAEPARVKELDPLIEGFLADTGATYPRPNPAFKPTSPKRANANTGDPLEGWKARQCGAVVKDGVLTMKATGKPGTAFLGHATGRMTVPATVKFRARSAAGGVGKVEWLPESSANPGNVKSVAFSLTAGDWQELSVEIPGTGPLGTLRLYLPADAKPVELDWVELRGKDAGAPQRWEFGSK
ncbi:MAG: N-acetylgalactosamine 6-sulfate sulfatase, partial [Chthoniobacteraceae bacterium]